MFNIASNSTMIPSIWIFLNSIPPSHTMNVSNFPSPNFLVNDEFMIGLEMLLIYFCIILNSRSVLWLLGENNLRVVSIDQLSSDF
jgi:hypothetical protein